MCLINSFSLSFNFNIMFLGVSSSSSSSFSTVFNRSVHCFICAFTFFNSPSNSIFLAVSSLGTTLSTITLIFSKSFLVIKDFSNSFKWSISSCISASVTGSIRLSGSINLIILYKISIL